VCNYNDKGMQQCMSVIVCRCVP